MKTNGQNIGTNPYRDNGIAWESEHYEGPIRAQNVQGSGLSYFGLVENIDGTVSLVLDITDEYATCFTRTSVLAGDTNGSWIYSGDEWQLRVFLEHIKRVLLTKRNKSDTRSELSIVCNIRETMYPSIQYEIVRGMPIHVTAGTTSGPEAGTYPKNISVLARRTWDSVVSGARYNKLSTHLKPHEKWALIGRLFLDACNRNGVSPFHADKAHSISSITDKYARQKLLATRLARQVVSNMHSVGLSSVSTLPNWKYVKTAYLNKRYSIVLETRVLTKTRKPSLIANHVLDEENFEKSNLGGWEHDVSPTTKLVIRLKHFPEITIRMIVAVPRDMLTVLGITGTNRESVLEEFQDVAEHWARTGKFAKSAKVTRI